MPDIHTLSSADGFGDWRDIARHYGVCDVQLKQSNPEIMARHPEDDPRHGQLEWGDQIKIPDMRFAHAPADQICASCPNAKTVDEDKEEEAEGVIIFVLNCADKSIGSEQIIVLEKKDSDKLKEEEEYWNDFARKLEEADHNGQGHETRVKDAKERVAGVLTRFVDSSKGVSQLTEIRRLAGKKTTYVRSDKLKNHRRRYSLAADDRKRSMINEKDGTLDKKKLKERFSEVRIRIQKDWRFDTTLAGSDNDFADYIDDINRSLKWSLQEGRDPKDVNFDVSTAAQLLRFYAGASVAGTWDRAKRIFGVNASIHSAIALAEGRLASAAYWPSKAGHRLSFEFKGEVVDLGNIRAVLQFAVIGFAGASAAGSFAVEITPDDAKGVLAFKGAEPVKKNQKGETTPFTASGKLFAGTEAGGEVAGALAWDNPEKRTNGKPAWKDFFKFGYTATGAAGIGVEAEFTIGFDGERFMFRAKAGIVVGLGAGGSVTALVDAGIIWEFVQFVYHKLKDDDFHFLDSITEEAFEALTRLMVWAIETGEDIKKLREEVYDTLEDSVESVAKKFREINEWWFFQRKVAIEKANKLAANIRTNPKMLKFTTPEAKGAMLFILTEDYWFRAVPFQNEHVEHAVIMVLSWVQSIHDYENVCKHITLDGSLISDDSTVAYWTGHKRILGTLDWGEHARFYEMYNQWWRKAHKTSYSIMSSKDTKVKQSFFV